MATTGFWDAMKEIAKGVGPLRPQMGQLAKVYRGKHKGRVGRIVWHGVDRYRYAESRRYCSEASAQLRDMMGRNGYRVGIEPVSYDEDGGEIPRPRERFYVNAEYIVTAVEGNAGR